MASNSYSLTKISIWSQLEGLSSLAIMDKKNSYFREREREREKPTMVGKEESKGLHAFS
jgi:hypothetical protein